MSKDGGEGSPFVISSDRAISVLVLSHSVTHHHGPLVHLHEQPLFMLLEIGREEIVVVLIVICDHTPDHQSDGADGDERCCNLGGVRTRRTFLRVRVEVVTVLAAVCVCMCVGGIGCYCNGYQR